MILLIIAWLLLLPLSILNWFFVDNKKGYFKSQQPDLFNLLYTVFKDEIDTYVMKGGTELAETLEAAAISHPLEIVQQTLSMEIETQSGGTVRVLDGILAELI